MSSLRTRLRTLVRRLAALVRSTRHEREIDDEIASHLEEAIDEYVARGLSPDEARLAARRDFGGITQAKERYRDVRTFAWPEHLRQDVAYETGDAAKN